MTFTSIGPYRILGLLGSGGMGEVYLAEDPRLARRVALKTLTPDPANRDVLEPLLREARAAATLSDPSIAAVHDVFELGGRAWLVMEYVEGETIAARLRRGPLPIDEAVDLTMQLLQGLEEAHRRGIVHRDLKPSNLMITPAGRLKILDFGIARVPVSSEERTQTAGAIQEIAGSPGYMAPERLLGRSADARADVYGVGVVLFEMLTGRPPVDAPDFMSAALQALTEPPPSVRDVNPSVPAALGAIVTRAMAHDPQDRFQTAAEIREALARVGAEPDEPATVPVGTAVEHRQQRVSRRSSISAVAALVILLAGVAFLARWVEWPPAFKPLPADAPVVAILPFENMTGDPGKEYLGFGFAHSLVTDLATLQDLTVVSLAAVREESGGNTRERKTVIRNLGASLLVEGSIQEAGNRLRINVGLLNSDATLVWSQAYEGSSDEPFELQRRLAAGVIRALNPAVRRAAAARTGDTSDVVALASYWQGRAFLERPDAPGNIEKAVAAFQSAVDRDTAYTAARAALGEASWLRYQETRDRRWVDRAVAETEAAVQQDPNHPSAHISLALVYRGTGRVADAVRVLERAIDLQPNNDDAHRLLGETLADSGRTAEGIAELRKAIDLRPRFARHHVRLGVVYYNVGRFDDAIAELETATELQPDNARGFHLLGAFYQTVGKNRQALESYARAIQLGPAAETFANIGLLHFDEGRFGDAVRSFEEAVRLRPNEPQNHKNLAAAYQRLDHSEKARESYLRAVALSEEFLKVNPGNVRTIGLLAVCLARLGRFDEAERRAAQAISINPKSGDAWNRQAAVHALAGRHEAALSALDRALHQGHSLTLASKDDDLRSIRHLPEFRRIIEKHRR